MEIYREIPRIDIKYILPGCESTLEDSVQDGSIVEGIGGYVSSRRQN